MATPKIYRWDDANAPQITDTSDWNQIKNWFTKIFVDGYGSKQPLSEYSLSFNDGSQYVTLSQTGNSDDYPLCDFRMYFDKMVNNNYYGCFIRLYPNNGHITTTLDYIPYSVSTTYHNSMVFGTNFGNVGKAVPWMVMGTKRQLHFFSGTNKTVDGIPSSFSNNNRIMWIGFGDYVNNGLHVGKYNQWLKTSSMGNWERLYTETEYNNEVRLFKSGSGLVVLYNPNLNSNYVGDTNSSSGNTKTYETMFSSNGIGSTDYLKNPYPYGEIPMKPMEMYYGKVYFGKISGMYYPLIKYPYTYSQGKSLHEFQDELGTNYMAIGDYSGEVIINIDEWDGID